MSEKKEKLSAEQLDEVAGGGDAVEQIQQIIDSTPKSPDNSMGQTIMKPPAQGYPTSAPYNF
jgi:hypothetical protein